ncbi:FG-GAP-like repeat-containing protein [Streptomyces bambusae]|uniref:FG-GAP-like repeat-containing protein n=1 Tax=Streptomyces bambusae TaxID=1550616 RepID=UPI001CFEB27C|nr:FG-GAP-like repeat-containing protein [Streptomyces bambusae]MCB5164524.1 FG-GAP-like repeat-containing protein [Streptomyces bambusae]
MAATGADLIAGDGNITQTPCTSSHQITVWARNLLTDESRICFAAANTGYLSVNIPRAYRIETNDRDIKASVSIEGSTQNLDVPKDTTKGFGEAHPTDPKRAVLLEMRVTGSGSATPQQPAGENPYAYLGKLRIGETRACTAVLVDPRWVMTAKSCFADKPAESIDVAAGAPKAKTVLTIGRKDLNASGGHTTEITELVPRTDRDLVMARLAQPVFTIAPVGVSDTAPAAGAKVTVPGYGRTLQHWAPAQAHKADFTVGAVAETGFDLTPHSPADAPVCKGDAGSPALQTVDGKTLIAGITSRAWQGGCIAETEPKLASHDTRVDGLASWIGSLTSRRSAAVNEAGANGRIRWADFDGDRKPDYFNIADNGSVSVWLNRGGNPAGSNGWQGIGQVATGLTNDRNRVRFADFDGDGKADYFLINTDGSVEVYLNQGGDPAGGNGWKHIGKVAHGVTNDASKVRFADWDGDGRSDYLAFADNGAVSVYLNRGGDQSGNGWPAVGKVASGVTSDRARIRFADNDGDGKADYLFIKPDGKVDLYVNRGGDVVPNTGWKVVGQIATGTTTDHTKVQFVDFNADTHADYVVAGNGNSASVWLWNGGDPAGGNGWNGIGVVASGT